MPRTVPQFCFANLEHIGNISFIGSTLSFGSETGGSKEPLGPIYISFLSSSHIFPGYCRRAVHTRFCTVLLVTVPQFCAPLYGNSVQPVTFADFFCDPFVRLRSKKERLRSVRRSTLTACSAEVNRFGLRFVRAHLNGVFLRSVKLRKSLPQELSPRLFHWLNFELRF